MSRLTMLPPRSYWIGLSDDTLAKARAEYQQFLNRDGEVLDTGVVHELFRIVDDIEDDLARREAYRDALAGDA